MTNVKPREGGPYSLYCYDCGEWVPNTANAEMQKEGCYSHRHWCQSKANDTNNKNLEYREAELHRIRTEARAEGARQERERIRKTVEQRRSISERMYDRTGAIGWNIEANVLKEVLLFLDSDPAAITEPEITIDPHGEDDGYHD